MPAEEEKVTGNLKTVHYQESPIMSTYLVAIVVGLFDYVEDQTSDGTYFGISEYAFDYLLLVNYYIAFLCRNSCSSILSGRQGKSRKLCIACCCQNAASIQRVCITLIKYVFVIHLWKRKTNEEEGSLRVKLEFFPISKVSRFLY